MYQEYRAVLFQLIRHALAVVAAEHINLSPQIERPKLASHGDFSTNLPLQLAKELGVSPRDLAERLRVAIPASDWIERVEVAGAGFLNFFLAPKHKLAVIHRIHQEADNYGRSTVGQGVRVQVEFVSANPTGPLHVGHGRGAAYGDSLVRLLRFAGFAVSSEYYINDAGRQMDILALSAWLRYLELHGHDLAFPLNAYRGQYVFDIAKEIASKVGTRYVKDITTLLSTLEALGKVVDEANKSEHETLLDVAIAQMKACLAEEYESLHESVLCIQLADCRADLEEFGVSFDVWFSEQSLYASGQVAAVVQQLEQAGYVYVREGAKWFASSTLGDEKDRVVQRENGAYTYFASDIAYHLSKYDRGFDDIIDVWGADHHGYIPRVKGAMQALGKPVEKLKMLLVQFAVLYRDGEKVSMSTRAGEFVTLRELRAEVGNDAARFFYLQRKSEQHLDFDLDLARAQSQDNPVYYVQYAHARLSSVVAQAGDRRPRLAEVDMTSLVHAKELSLCNLLLEFPEVVESAAREYAPHAVAFYLKNLAGEIHSYYNAERILVGDEDLQLARLALVLALKQVLKNGLSILGVHAPDSM